MFRSFRSPLTSTFVVVLVLSFIGTADAYAQRVSATVDSTNSVIDYTGSATMHDWTGTSRSVSGTMVLDLDTPDSSRVVIRVPVASFESGPDRRDRKMQEVTEAQTYPMVEFRTTDIHPTHWGRTSDGHSGRWRVTGDLTFHGQTHPVEAAVDLRTTEDSVHARAQFPVSLTRFEVERPEVLWVAPIGDTIRIDARVAGKVESASGQKTSQLKTERSAVTGTERTASTELRNVTPVRYDGTGAGLRTEVRVPPDGARQWVLAIYAFTDRPTGLAEMQEATLRADQQAVTLRRVEGTARQLDDGTTVEISRMYLSQSAFETLADAMTVTASLGSARFSVGWRARQDMRLILKEVSSDSFRPVSTSGSN